MTGHREMRDHFGRNKPAAEIDRALGVLAEAGRIRRGDQKETKGRAAEVWYAVRWTADGAVMDLGVPTTLEVFISADGSVASGTRTSPMFDAFRWTASEGVTSLQTQLSVRDMTPDGRMIVGTEFRSVSDDGRVMVGGIHGTPTIWFEGTGTMRLQPFLTGLGLDLTGWRLTDVRAISGDGTTIAGHGIPPDPSMSGAWIAVIPEPSTLLLAAIAGIALSLMLTRFRV